MDYQKERDEFIGIMAKEGLSLDVARKLLRHAQTLHRLAVAQCNGDWPADNGERKVKFCPRCEAGFVPSSFKTSSTERVPRGDERGERYHARNTATLCALKVCPDCRTVELVHELMDEANNELYKGRDWKEEHLKAYAAVINGDPRGSVLVVQVPSGFRNSWSQVSEGGGVCVPVRDR